MTVKFQKAERSAVKLKIGIQGPSGSGKTMGALSLARALAKADNSRVALIDSENGRSSYYADDFDFDQLILPGHLPESYIEAIDAAVDSGYRVIVIDSLAHAWYAVLAAKEDYDRANPRSNSWTNWRLYGPRWEKLIRHILDVPAHVVCTMRSKQAYEQTEQNGKKQVVKIGLKPEVREGAEYELALVFDVGSNHKAEATKDNTNLFDGRQVDLCSEQVPAELLAWLSSAKKPDPATAEQLGELGALAADPALPVRVKNRILELLKGDLGKQQAETVIDATKKVLDEQGPVAA